MSGSRACGDFCHATAKVSRGVSVAIVAPAYLPGGVIREVDYATQSGGLDPVFAGIKIVDCDTHITEAPDLFTSRAPAAWKRDVT